MKKIKTFVMALAIGAMGCAVNSCGTLGQQLANNLISQGATMLTQNSASNSTKSQLVGVGAEVLQALVSNSGGTMSGKKQTYQGTYTAQLLTLKNGNYQNSGNPTTTTSTSTLTVGSNVVGISMPAISAGGASMTQVTLTNLVAANGNYILGDNSTATEGKLTVGGKTYDLANCYIELRYTGTTSLSYEASIYFDLNASTQQYNYAMNVTFKK